jgi:hypothetical protein
MADADRVVEVLKEAQKAVADSAVPADLRPAAFREAVRLLTSESSPAGPIKTGAIHTGGAGAGGIEGTGGLVALANKLGVSAEAIGEVYHDDSGDIKLIVASAKLQSDKGAATKQIAVLIAGDSAPYPWKEKTSPQGQNDPTRLRKGNRPRE